MCSGTTAALVLPTSTVDLRVAALGGVLVEHLRPGWEAWSARRITAGRPAASPPVGRASASSSSRWQPFAITSGTAPNSSSVRLEHPVRSPAYLHLRGHG